MSNRDGSALLNFMICSSETKFPVLRQRSTLDEASEVSWHNPPHANTSLHPRELNLIAVSQVSKKSVSTLIIKSFDNQQHPYGTKRT